MEIDTHTTSNLPLTRFCQANRLLQRDDGICRLPFLIKGEVRLPKTIARVTIEEAFRACDARRSPGTTEAHSLTIDDVQVLREAVIDRDTMKGTGEWAYSVMPAFKPHEVVDHAYGELVHDLYNMPFSEVLRFVKIVEQTLALEYEFIDRVRAETLQTSQLPDLWHNAGFAAFPILLNENTIGQLVDNDLRAYGIRGRDLLDTWQSVPQADLSPAPINIAMALIDSDGGSAWRERKPQLRAMPTRQLHITAGNSPQIPLLSLIRAIATKSPAVIKLPFGATAPGSLIALAAAVALPNHPLTRHLSVVYWPGGDRKYEDTFFLPTSFDRIVVWGAPTAVISVKERAPFSKVLAFNPRFGLSLIGREAFATGATMHEAAVRAISDSLIANQKACIASQVLFVEGTDEQIISFAREVQSLLKTVDAQIPNHIEPSLRGALRRLQNGGLINADWFTNDVNGQFSSGVVIAKNEFNVAQHPMCRLLVLRPVRDLREALSGLTHAVSTVSVFPANRKDILRDEIAARGVSNVVTLGESGTGYAGQSHDGMMVLTELVDWKNS